MRESKENILFVTIDGGGNLPPVLGLAEEFHERGYQVSVLSEPCLEGLITSLGYQFIPFQKYFTRKDRKEDIFKDSNVSPMKNPVLDNIVFGPAINETRSRLNLPRLEQTSDLVHGADLRLIQTLERFDFPLEPKPENVRYTGPFLNDPDWISPWSDPWPGKDSRPLVVISLSSTFQNQYAAIQSAMDALRGQEIRGLVTLGPVLRKESFTVPENVVVVESAPHSEVFPEADLVITHAGHGTVMKALSHGLPLVCLPMGRDQNDNAIKIQHHGCGMALSAKAGPEKIRKAVLHILSEGAFRKAAAGFQKEIRANDQKHLMWREIEDLMDPNNEREIRLEEADVRYA